MKRTTEKTVINLRIEVGQKEKFKELCEKMHVEMSEKIRELIEKEISLNLEV